MRLERKIDDPPDSLVATEETFGPVAPVVAIDSLEHAIELANDSPYGLSGAVFSRDAGAAYEVACRLRTGEVSLNGGAGTVNHNKDMVEVRSLKIGDRWERPENVTIKRCNIGARPDCAGGGGASRLVGEYLHAGFRYVSPERGRVGGRVRHHGGCGIRCASLG